MSRYTVHIWPEPWKEIKESPGNIRQRLRRAIDKLADDPRPSKSKPLEFNDDTAAAYELLRLRLESWRVIYVITEQDKTVDVLAIRKRPPYDYKDLKALLNNLLASKSQRTEPPDEPKH
jgi:mRNA interferase RelE/StbE